MISLVIPIFNRAKLLGDTLQSVKEQSFENWECLIVDDGSTDNSINVAQSFCTQDPRFKLLQRDREPKGAPTCRNIGWQNAANEYIVFLDSDDLLAPWALEERLSFFEKNKGCDFVLSPAMEFRKSTNDHKTLRSKINIKKPLERFLLLDAVWQTSCPTWKKSTLIKINGWDERANSWQDGEIHIRALLLRNINYRWCSELPDVFIRIDSDSTITSTFDVSKRLNNFETYQRIYAILKDLALKKAFEKTINEWLFHILENLTFHQGNELLKMLRNKNFEYHLKTQRATLYLWLYSLTKNIVGVRKMVFLIRQNSSFFTKRRPFRFNESLSSEKCFELQVRLANNALLISNITWLNNQ